MSGTATPQPSSDNIWPESSSSEISSPSFAKNRKRSHGGYDYLSAVDESPDFHDPYSDLSLFLSQKIKHEMHQNGSAKKWSIKIQEDLIKNITPDFQKKFPHYRLGIAALRKIWDKISYYTQQIQGQREALTSDGKLNIPFFIRENLKQYAELKNPFHLQPYHYAHQLAMKMSECIATIDGIRPKLDELTRTIWSVQRHLLSGIPQEKMKSPYDAYDKVDRLIVKTILETTAKEPRISQIELEHKVKESLHSLHDLPSFATLDTMTCNVSALLAQKLYFTSRFHNLFFSEQKNALSHFVKRHAALCRTSLPLPDLVRRMMSLYTLASQLPKELSDDEMRSAIHAFYTQTENRPNVDQSVYAFISAEGMLMQYQQEPISQEEGIATIAQAYQEAKLLPHLAGKDLDLLEMAIWKQLAETEGLLEKLPYLIGQKIEEEIANTIIDTPHQSFSSIVHLTVQFFQRTKELALQKKWSDIERKIHTWTLQGDMLCRAISLDIDSPLLKLIVEKWQLKKYSSHWEFVSDVCMDYLGKFPDLAMYAPQLSLRIWILYKYLWYSLIADVEESSMDRFLKWHAVDLSHLSQENLLQQLEELCKKALPLVPFNQASCTQIVCEKAKTAQAQ